MLVGELLPPLRVAGKAQKVKQAEQRLQAGSAWQAWTDEAEHKKALVFTTAFGTHLGVNTAYHHYKRIAAKIGADDTCVRDLRHTYAVLSLQNGDDVKTVQEHLGHATASFTLDVYGHVSERMRKASAERMQEYIKGRQTAKG